MSRWRIGQEKFGFAVDSGTQSESGVGEFRLSPARSEATIEDGNNFRSKAS